MATQQVNPGQAKYDAAIQQPEPPPLQPQPRRPAPRPEPLPKEPEQSAYHRLPFEGTTYRFDRRQYDTVSIKRWFAAFTADRRTLAPEDAGGRTSHRDSEEAQALRRQTPLSEQGRKEWAEILDVAPEEITPELLREHVKEQERLIKKMADQEGINPVRLRELREDTAYMKADAERPVAGESDMDVLFRSAGAAGQGEVKPAPMRTTTFWERFFHAAGAAGTPGQVTGIDPKPPEEVRGHHRQDFDPKTHVLHLGDGREVHADGLSNAQTVEFVRNVQHIFGSSPPEGVLDTMEHVLNSKGTR